MTLHVYVDNSDIWIEGQSVQAVRTGAAEVETFDRSAFTNRESRSTSP